METTKPSASLTLPVSRARGLEGASSLVAVLTERISAAGYDGARVSSALVETVLQPLGFEQGLVLAQRAGREDFEVLAAVEAPPANGAVPGSARPAASRPPPDPAYFVDRAVVLRAVATRQAVIIDDSLISRSEGGPGVHRAVLCCGAELFPGKDVALYLLRGIRGEAVRKEDGEVLSLALSLGAPALARALLLGQREARPGPGGDVDATSPDQEESDSLDAAVGEVPNFHGIVGRSESIEKVLHVVRKVADSDLNICVFGESGTGKEVLARALHQAGSRRDKPFLAENCGAIAENLLESELFGHVRGAFTGADEEKKGLFELASGGTLFLDEVGDMSEGMQRKLLRVLQEGVVRPVGGKQSIKVAVRVICASNRDLRDLVESGTFRPDLYYRLNVASIELPPLRERREDIPLLVLHLLRRIGDEEGIQKRVSRSALRCLSEHSWPGNIRELYNVLRRAVVTSPRPVLVRKDLVELLSPPGGAPRSGANLRRDGEEVCLRIPARDSFNGLIDECERVILQNSLDECSWNKSRVTKALKIPRQSLYNKIEKFGLERTWATTEGSPPASGT